MPWSVCEEKYLLDLINERKSLKEIAELLDRSARAVIEKITRLGLSIEFLNRRVEQAHRARFRRRTHALLNNKTPGLPIIATESPLLHENRSSQDVLGQCCGVHHRASETVAHGKPVKKEC